MNKNNLHQIFSGYIEKFADINDDSHYETYKWKAAKDFRRLMDEALSKNGQEFVEALKKAKAATHNIIDSYTVPFNGLVEFAKIEPETVKQMFLDLYEDDGGDLDKQKQLIADFFASSQVLLDRHFPGSHLFKQNSHSVSAYLFLYDPDHHYMYKASEASKFADCIEFYDDWGAGDHIKLETFYRMCDELVEEIKKNEALLITDKSRFDDRLDVKPEDLFEDREKHMLAFDLIYCCEVYGLYHGISFARPKAKEKRLLLEKEKKAKKLERNFEKAKEAYDSLIEGKRYFVDILKVGTEVKHNSFGMGTVESIDDQFIVIRFHETKEKKRLSLDALLENKIISLDIQSFGEHLKGYLPLIKKKNSIESTYKRLERNLMGLKR